MSPIKIIVGLGLCYAVAQLGTWGWQQWQLTKPGYHQTDCWFSTYITGDTRCGYMVVPENRQVADSRTIRLPVVIFEALQKSRQHNELSKEPILYLTGGPGDQAYIGQQKHVDSWWLERRIFPKGHDLIVLGQRGTGLKEPDFDCEEMRTPEVVFAAVAKGTKRRKLLTAAAAACAARLQREGVDLTAYNSRESAADVAELRQALGIEQWTLYGVSYGTRLALSTLRYHPEGIRSVILDSVYPPEANNLIDNAEFYRVALQRLFGDCDTFSPCDSDPAGLMTEYARLRDRLAAEPVDYDLRELDLEIDMVLSIDERFFDNLLFKALYNRKSRRHIPPMIRNASKRSVQGQNVQRLARLLLETLEDSGSGSKAVRLSHICRDEAAFESLEEIAAAAAAAGPLGHMIAEDTGAFLCEVWPAGKADPIENEPVTSEVPALLLAGALDPVTPPALARSAAAGLPNGYLFEFWDAGHGLIYEMDCMPELIAEFLENPSREPAGRCTRQAFLASGQKTLENSR